jgi:hypothetical protein
MCNILSKMAAARLGCLPVTLYNPRHLYLYSRFKKDPSTVATGPPTVDYSMGRGRYHLRGLGDCCTEAHLFGTVWIWNKLS